MFEFLVGLFVGVAVVIVFMLSIPNDDSSRGHPL